MRVVRVSLGVLLTSVGLLLAFLAPPAAAQISPGSVVVLRLEGVVDDINADYISREVARASDANAAAVVIGIDTPGGLSSSMNQITEALLAATVPTVTYVAPQGARAASAGAFVLLAGSIAAMAPGTNTGASTPVGLDGGDLSTKISEDAAASIRSLAQTYGRNPELAASFVLEGRSVSAEEALEGDVIELIAPTRDALLREIDGRTVDLASGERVTLSTAGATVEERELGGFLGFLHGLFDPTLAFLFFWLGLALIVLELLIPGHVFSGTVGTVLLLISLFSFGVLPVRWFGVLLLIAAVVFFVIELNAPGLGLFGAAATVCTLLGGWFLYDRSGGAAVSPLVLIPTAALMAGFFGFVVTKVMRMRNLPPVQGPEAIVGKDGVVVGLGVDPRGGVVRVSAEEWKAVAPAGPLSPGARIRVTALDGLVLTVEPLEAGAPSPPTAPDEQTPADLSVAGDATATSKSTAKRTARRTAKRTGGTT
ncbi:MAG TPA: nodulation protein NfeD [Actinomycetota bacterium]|nr:nodulation protein NfeD [Actinomycetota bacterium]